MQLPKTLSLLLACLTLAQCNSGTASGKLVVPPLPPSLASSCKAPEAVTGPSYKALVGNMGVALIECGAKHDGTVAAYDGLAGAVRK